jgi:class 3 adenylate cyclase
MPSKNLAVMFTDIKGFTERTSDATRGGLTDYIRSHERLLLPVFRYFHGTVIKTIGDAFLVTFESPTDAVLCGMTIQEVLRQHNALAKNDKERMTVRVAINAGEIELKNGDIFGDAVNIASRLEGIAEAGEVYFTEAVYQTMNRKEAPSTSIGERTFKGVPFPIRVYKVIKDPKSGVHERLAEAVRLTKEGPVIKGLATSRRKMFAFKSPALAVGVVLLLGIAASGAYFLLRTDLDLKTLRNAERLMAGGEHLAALELIDRSLATARDPLKLYPPALAAAEAHIEFLLKERTKKETLEWIRQTVNEKPYLGKLMLKVPALDAEVTVSELMDKRVPEYLLWEEIRALVKRYPEDPEVPYVVGVKLQDRHIVEVSMWLFEEAVARGKDPNAPLILASFTKALTRNHPESSWGKDAHAFLEKYHKDAYTAWARKEIKQGTKYTLLNAWEILKQSNDSVLDDPFLKNLHTITVGEDITAALAEVRRTSDKEKQEHVIRALADAQGISQIKSDVKKEIRKVLAELRTEWNIPNHTE